MGQALKPAFNNILRESERNRPFLAKEDFIAISQPASKACAFSDGAKYGATPSGFSACQPDSESPRWFMALVVWPGRDYHWYRCHQERYWGHKPGQTAARNTDNSNRVISNPETCDRGPYTNFCGWFISGKSSKVN